MKILKFGGTSVGTPERMRQVAAIINNPEPKIVILSAVAGTTNSLESITELHTQGKTDEALQALDALREDYNAFVKEIYSHPLSEPLGWNVLEMYFGLLNNTISDAPTAETEKIILAQGELISTKLFHYLLLEMGIDNEWIPALDFMKLDHNNEPDLVETERLVNRVINSTRKTDLYITQGYICKDSEGLISNLQRGGSDYSATILGAVLNVDEIQIWTDIDGVHNNDPRIVEDTYPLQFLSYREAAELAYFGAKILHPTCVLPAEKKAVPIRLKNTMDPAATGTLISEISSQKPVTAIAAKDNIIMINIHSHRMLLAYGFLRKIFEIFEKYNTPIDMITTSEVAVSLTIDQDLYLHEILEELQSFGEVKYFEHQSIICLVGDNLDSQTGYASKIFSALNEVPIKMISYGGSNNNVSILVDGQLKNTALNHLNSYLFKSVSA